MKIGCDPEFGIRDDIGTFIPADQFFSSSGKIGHDAHPATGELRPSPKNNPLAVSDEIGKLMNKIIRDIGPSFSLHGGSLFSLDGNEHTIGGHIHLDLKKSNFELARRALNLYLGTPFAFVEEPAFRNERRRHYGNLGDIREQRWGIEYRSLSSFLTSKSITNAALCMAYVIGRELNDNKRFFRKDKDVFAIVQSSEFRSAFSNSNFDKMREVLPHARKRFRHMKLYGTFQSEINYLWSLTDQNLHWQEQRDAIPRFNGKRIPYLILPSYYDLHCPEIASLIKINEIPYHLLQVNKKVRFYGLARTRSCDICVSNKDLADKLSKSSRFKDYTIRNTEYGPTDEKSLEIQKKHPLESIGISFDIRKKKEVAKKLLLKILKVKVKPQEFRKRKEKEVKDKKKEDEINWDDYLRNHTHHSIYDHSSPFFDSSITINGSLSLSESSTSNSD